MFLSFPPTAVRSALYLPQGSITQKTASQDPKLIPNRHQKRNENTHVHNRTGSSHIYTHSLHILVYAHMLGRAKIDSLKMGINKLCLAVRTYMYTNMCTQCHLCTRWAHDTQLQNVQNMRSKLFFMWTQCKLDSKNDCAAWHQPVLSYILFTCPLFPYWFQYYEAKRQNKDNQKKGSNLVTAWY